MKRKRIIRRGGLAPDKYLTMNQVDRLKRHLNAAAALRSNRAAVNRFIVMLLLYSGLRADEMLSLRIEDTPAGHGKPSIDVKRGKGCVARAIDIPEWFCDVIRDFIVANRKGAKPGSTLLASEKGFRTLWIDNVEVSNGSRLKHKRQERSARMTYHCLLKRIKRIGIAAGIGRLTPHMLRHTFATMLYAQGCDVFYVQDQLGHSDPKVTQIYARTFSESRKRQTNSLPVW